MKINDVIAAAYLKREKIAPFSGEWYYIDSGVPGMPENIFTEPKADAETRQKAKTVYDAIFHTAETFVPLNQPVWDALFPDWQDVLSDISVDLIAGYPEPFDATVKYDPEGKCHIIFDLACWANYVGHCELSKLILNLMTHELCHVMLHKHVDGLAKACDSTGYHAQLDAGTFDEGFAHLVSYESMEMGSVNWQSKALNEIRERHQARMRAALAETDPAIQQKNLYDAFCGNYYDKFACMCGMLYLANRWLKGGLPALKGEFEQGYRRFAEKTAL